MQAKRDIRNIIADNLVWLMKQYRVSRKQLCDSLDIKYTTLCDWLNARTYPRIDTLERLAGYFSIDISWFFVEIVKDESLVSRITEYSRRLLMKDNYEDTYPEGFFELFGSLKDSGLEEPEDLPAEDAEIL